MPYPPHLKPRDKKRLIWEAEQVWVGGHAAPPRENRRQPETPRGRLRECLAEKDSARRTRSKPPPAQRTAGSRR